MPEPPKYFAAKLGNCNSTKDHYFELIQSEEKVKDIRKEHPRWNCAL